MHDRAQSASVDIRPLKGPYHIEMFPRVPWLAEPNMDCLKPYIRLQTLSQHAKRTLTVSGPDRSHLASIPLLRYAEL